MLENNICTNIDESELVEINGGSIASNIVNCIGVPALVATIYLYEYSCGVVDGLKAGWSAIMQ